MYVVDDPTLALISRFVGGGETPERSDEEFFERQLATVQTHVASFPEAEREARALAWIESNARLYRQQWQKQIAVTTLQATRCPDCPLANGGDRQTPCAIHAQWLELLRRYVGSAISSHDYVEQSLALLARHKAGLRAGHARSAASALAARSDAGAAGDRQRCRDEDRAACPSSPVPA
ncbi:MAG: hypothetical protein AW08_01016 [Candidatus Accumulibacter adjunctus]|uniref:Uncharacterized protein n=1 Tax=Candidatus Accumulibacter adjunctus TaxID=1454001 RepID=A0A011PQU8_9PROT|nr:MAG: hypothetical protein AW08_01016 [Candidatus Accumulibacter adjunctus]